MMEGLNQLGQEEYIWAMRTHSYRNSAPDLKERSGYQPRRSKSNFETNIDDHQTKVMASLVPDEVIYNVDDYSHRKYDACFLFGDVSGFTELCEKYTKTGISGPSRMTQVLNQYLGSMVQEVMAHNGDVLKFSGDAFLAIFKSSETETLRDAVHEACDCALIIQKSYGSYLTDVGVVIRVKLAISAGLVTFALIGEIAMSHYVVVGKPIWDVKAAESISSAGDIIVAPAAWHYVNTNDYLFEDMPDGIHIKITGVGPTWRSVQKSVRQTKDEDDEDGSQDGRDSSDSLDSSDASMPEGATDEFSLRPAVNTAARLKIKEALRRFIIAPVMKSIDMDEPFEYLTEMRQAVIVFINVVSFKVTTEQTVILADRTYKVVCRVVEKMKGCVNKVSLFDKDLMFVVIFGLRGLKHELECQVALKCAKECHTAINKLPSVLSASIGVTTGKTYCGVFGHTLRREYTVISLIVNKAARLMVAYKGKVTCDRDTFLHSKLEARHFILQDYKPLKGISHPGPVYEYREAEVDHDHVIQHINACPLLGRTEKLKVYKNLLSQCMKTKKTEHAQYKMMLIMGEARQGKTRLLDELVYITPTDISVNKFTLTHNDHKIPYQTIRLIFNLPLLLTTESQEKERQDKLLNMMKNLDAQHLFCALNDVFGVNFKKSKEYLKMKEPERRVALRKMIKQLAYACFVKLWVLAIDDCEYVDDWSWELLRSLFNIKTIFVVATMGNEKLNKSTISQQVVDDPRVKTVYLTAIERMYLGALACQIMDVYAISPELENAIQTKSNGNPGWIESFLISLMQDECLYLLRGTLRDINDLGLVCPPLYMMERLTEKQKRKWQLIMEETRTALDDVADDDEWKRYIDSCRDSYLNVTVREEMESIAKGGKVPICVTAPNFKVGDDEMELSMDAIILKTFDSLNSFEQLLVKCSAILGYQFFRNLLLYVMAARDTRQAAIAVKRLFEIKVLACAKGDFIEAGDTVPKEKLLNPTDEVEPKCYCRGLRIEISCYDLPKYASCGYLQFRSSLFREITFNLLTYNQKKEFHQRAIRYLERETRRCQSCGFGIFDRILGVWHDKEFLTARNKRKHVGEAGAVWEADAHSRRPSMGSDSLFSGSVTGPPSFATARNSVIAISKKMRSEEKSIMSSPSLASRENRDEKSYKSFFGITVIKKLKDSYSLTRTFSSDDFTDCQCNLILTTTYAQLIEHCIGAGDINKLIEALMEYAHVCIITSNLPLAMKTLDECLAVMAEKSEEKIENSWKLALVRAKIYTLIGFSRLELGHLDQAYDSLHLALAEYDITFPTGINRQVMICGLQAKQLFGFYVFPSTLLKNLDHWQTIYANNLSECLSHLCTLYMTWDEWTNAELAAAWALTKSLESFTDFRVICTAAANMLHVALYFSKWNLCVALEVYALRLCHLKQKNQSEDLTCVAKLYSVIFLVRLACSQLEKAIHMGYIVLKICSSINAVQIIQPLLPLMVQALMMCLDFNSTYAILQDLYYFAEDDTDCSGKVWYYALCVGLQLATGYTVVAYNICDNFYHFEGNSWVTIRDPEGRKRFFSVMWLWCIRNEKWEEAANWYLKTADDWKTFSPEDSVESKITALHILEGWIIFLVSKLDRRNIEAIMTTEQIIQHLFKTLEKSSQSVNFILPRLYHLKAYYRYVRKNDSKVQYFLKKAANFARKQQNLLEIGWIEYSKKAWAKELSPATINFWKDHSETGNLLDFADIATDEGKLGYFTLPPPMYL